MRAMSIKVMLEGDQFRFQVVDGPEGCVATLNG
jgi:hypothetical protein